ncbi:AMP-binding protein [Antrihabitans stalactiti]|uniref:AMP-binding protein n=1 Tax=Antrihabitans stalactiti TaxID=2584121 RepID=A0A848KAK0_9NOCA|nr:AMP-binding protein [Antrihabitans stalactiti]NMN94254.1 AMP-binding protein [Antrihabitans stalactiti]
MLAAGQLRVLQRSGLIDLRRPLTAARKARNVRKFGPIAGGVRACADVCPDTVALIDADGELTYRELDERTDQLARRWMREGIAPTGVVAVLCRDNRTLVETMVATAKIGARLVLLNTGFSATQLSDVAGREGVTAIVFDPELASTAAELTESFVRLDASAVVREHVVGQGRIQPPARQGGFVLLTGGTTGTPKGAPRRIESPLAAAQFLDRVPLHRGRTILLCAPLFHGTALSQFILGLNLGCTIILHGRFDAKHAVAQIARHRCDAVVLVPTMLRRILDIGDDELARHDTSSLEIIFSAGAALPPALGDRTQRTFGPVLYNFYGSTETGTATIATPDDWRAAPGTVGRPPIGITVALFDEAGRRVTRPGDVGTVYVGNSIAFAGYSGGGSKKTVDGMMSTGDLGHFDSAGRLFIDGRDDDMIVSGGENVFPGEVEDLLYGHPAVAEAAVLGVPDDEFGQRLAAFVVRGGDGEIDEAGVRDYVKAKLARFKAPRDVVFVDELPRTTTGKIDRTGLRAL